MGILDFFRHKKEIDLDAERRARLQRDGRITEGTILDSETDESGGETVYYYYTVNGANFESSEILSRERLTDPLKYAPGAKVGVRYDQRQHGNSMLE